MTPRNLNILLVDDEPSHAEALRRILVEADPRVEVRAAGTLSEYRAMAAAAAPDIAVMDLNLPDGRAIETLISPPEEGPFPVLLMTSYGDEQIAVSAMKAGAIDYVVKSPEAFAAMPRTIERARREWNLLQERKRASAKLRDNQRRLATLVSNLPGIVYRCRNDRDRTMQFISDACFPITGFPPEDFIGNRRLAYNDIVHPDYRESLWLEWRKTLEQRGIFEAEYPVRTEEGETKWFWERGRGVFDEEGTVLFLEGYIEDITGKKKADEELRASLREKEVLLREIHHRVKNNMQVVSSLFNLQARHTADRECRDILREGQTRLRSMSLVHEKLYQSPDLAKIDLGGYILSLAVHLFHVYLVKTDQVRLETEFEEVSLDVNSAIPCGLLLNELISNALKHAFPGDRTGVVKIKLTREPEGRVKLRVSDDGVGFPENVDFRNAGSFGLQIVNLLVDQLEAEFELDRTNGTSFTVAFRELKYAPRM